ncbi:penicillin-binding protein activator [Lysobacter sp. N42]|uniref:penicillin-binding protein activator n=1 Tax=Lysobacter sp. N42 TaxID=2545719 RepID=UPI0014048F7F|nr:penicillin-binding protein activator [Lysobacter sp. N42]
MPKKLFTCIAILILTGCGSTPEPVETVTPVTVEPEPVEVIPPTAEEWLEMAQETTSAYEAQSNLLMSATEFLNENRHHHAGAILTQMTPRLLRPEELQKYRLQRARFFVAIEDWESAESMMTDLVPRLSDIEDQLQGMQINYQLAAAKEAHFSAATQLIALQEATEGNDLTQDIWNHLRKVPVDVWREDVRARNDIERGWFEFMKTLTRALDRLENMSFAIESWQTNYPDHQATRIAADILGNPSLSTLAQRVAVLLPLSGQYAAQGEAVRYGMLAALSQRGQVDVRFIDTSQFNRDEIAEQLELFDAQVVIGPLDRPAVQRVAGIEDRQWSQLTLNHAPDDIQLDNTAYFALDLSAETQAAAYAMNLNGHRNILLLGPNNNRGQQLAELFTDFWSDNHPRESVDAHFYSTSNEMRDVVRQSMGVQASEDRQAYLESQFSGEDIEMEFRSRQDIDAIYLLGDATQARLLKPFIDVSISAFANRIPVYANSTVNREAVTEGEADLDGVLFSDAPWLLPNHEQADLHQEMVGLLNGWDRNQQRLTAMGYDSIRLAPRFNLMRLIHGYEYNGLTGRLRIENNTVVRRLSWATFEGSTIQMEPIGYVNEAGRR